jgi:hypothetical protein
MAGKNEKVAFDAQTRDVRLMEGDILHIPMNYTLASFGRMAPGGGPDLREELRKRRATQHDLKIRASEARFDSESGRICLKMPEGRFAVRVEALADFARRAGLARSEAMNAGLLTDRLQSQGEVLVRTEGDDIRAILPGATRLVDNLELVERIVQGFREVPTEIRIEHCREEEGELYLTAVAPELAAEAGVGDYLYGGFLLANSETALLDTEACARIFRLACSNGALADFTEGRSLVLPRLLEAGRPDPYVNWPGKLAEVIARSFDGGNFDEDSRRFRSTMDQILATPYEFLLNLAAQGLITDEEQVRIQKKFREADDATMYGLINAVTRIAHAMRDGNDLRRASDIERLAGEIIRGDHQPPVMEPAYR